MPIKQNRQLGKNEAITVPAIGAQESTTDAGRRRPSEVGIQLNALAYGQNPRKPTRAVSARPPLGEHLAPSLLPPHVIDPEPASNCSAVLPSSEPTD